MKDVTSGAGLSEGEYQVLLLHRHWKTIVRPLFVLALTVVALVVALIMMPTSVPHLSLVQLALSLLALLVVIVFTGIPFLRWRTTSYELTNRRLRLRTGILARRGRDFPLTRISDVSFEQGLSDRLLRCGRLIVESPGEHGQLVLTEIPQVQHVQSTLFQLVEDEQERLGREQQTPY